METNLTNQALATGNYDNIPTSISSDALVVVMIDGLKITKEADKMVWADGALTYTITIDNTTEKTYAAPVVTDTLDISLVSFVPNSVTVDGTALEESSYTYDEASGLLTINLTDILASGKKVITFQVTKKV